MENSISFAIKNENAISKKSIHTNDILIFTNPYGGGLVVWEKVGVALDIAQCIIQKITKAGVRIALGLNADLVNEYEDVIDHNLVGAAVNMAARLVSIPDLEGYSAACEKFFEQATKGLHRTHHGFFMGPFEAKVKHGRCIK